MFLQNGNPLHNVDQLTARAEVTPGNVSVSRVSWEPQEWQSPPQKAVGMGALNNISRSGAASCSPGPHLTVRRALVAVFGGRVIHRGIIPIPTDKPRIFFFR